MFSASFRCTLDAPPPESVLTQLLDRVGKAARESKRVEVDFDTIAPSASEFWTGDSTDELAVPIGRMGATRLQILRFGRGVAQHALVAGKTGSGKSTLLHALVTNLAMWYSPDQIELYLIDFKKGVEFKTYATHMLPHARAIAVESDREFGVSVLQRLDAELAHRGELFRNSGVQDLAAYRKTPDAVVMPRTLLVIDEFQEFFSEDAPPCPGGRAPARSTRATGPGLRHPSTPGFANHRRHLRPGPQHHRPDGGAHRPANQRGRFSADPGRQ